MEQHRLSQGPVVVIIGAGFAGIMAAIELKEKLGFKNFLVLEKASDVGGTWRDNTYPGCRCDVNSFFYSLSTDLKGDWHETCATQPDILTYIKSVVAKHELAPHILFNTRVASANWSEDAQAYEVIVENQKGVPSTLTANYVIAGVGLLHVPRMPNIPGLESYQGKIIHSARWDSSVDLKGKRVAVIGNGSTGAQIMSQLPKIEGIQVTQFFRSRNWVMPSLTFPVLKPLQWIGKYVPLASRLYRWLAFWLMNEVLYLMMFKYKFMREPMKKVGGTYMRLMSPKKYHELLVPDFPIGCRRIILDPGYLTALNRPNVDVRVNAIASICPEGIITTGGEKLPFDVIVAATGFVAEEFPIAIRGQEKLTLQEHYDKTGGPNAYLGTFVPGFPNLALLGGPNTLTGYTSFVFFEEVQTKYISKMLKHVLDGDVSSFDIKEAPNAKYNAWLQENLKDSVYSAHNSWYRLGGSGKNYAIFPGSAILYWWYLRSVEWSHYKVTGQKASVKLGQSGGIGLASIVALASVAALVAGLNLSK